MIRRMDIVDIGLRPLLTKARVLTLEIGDSQGRDWLSSPNLKVSTSQSS